MLGLRFVLRNWIGPKSWPQWTKILVILPALLCQLSQQKVSAGGKRFSARPPCWFTWYRTSANVEGAGRNQSRQSYTCLVSTCPLAGESGRRPHGETFPSRRNLLLRQLTQEGGQDDEDSCALRPKLWTNTVPEDHFSSEHLNEASKTTTNLIRLCSFKSSCEFGFVAYPKRCGLSIASRPFG